MVPYLLSLSLTVLLTFTASISAVLQPQVDSPLQSAQQALDNLEHPTNGLKPDRRSVLDQIRNGSISPTSTKLNCWSDFSGWEGGHCQDLTIEKSLKSTPHKAIIHVHRVLPHERETISTTRSDASALWMARQHQLLRQIDEAVSQVSLDVNLSKGETSRLIERRWHLLQAIGLNTDYRSRSKNLTFNLEAAKKLPSLAFATASFGEGTSGNSLGFDMIHESTHGKHPHNKTRQINYFVETGDLPSVRSLRLGTDKTLQGSTMQRILEKTTMMAAQQRRIQKDERIKERERKERQKEIQEKKKEEGRWVTISKATIKSKPILVEEFDRV